MTSCTPRIVRVLAGLLAAGLLACPAAAGERPATDLAAGKTVYERHCARCHGVEGDGQGPDAKRLYPAPRNFTLGTYKFRSTASGTPPTDADLFRIITNGLPGSGMPAWGGLSDEERWRLVDYVKHFSPAFTERQPEPVSPGRDPGPKGADPAKGRTVYEQLQCAACHGKQGRGDGPSAMALTDDWGQPIRPADLTQGWTYRGGDAARDIYLRFTTGIDGAPMPSYADASSEADRWQLAYYVQSLQEPPRWAMRIQAVRAAGALPASASDPLWAAVPHADLGLSGLVYVEGGVSAAMVKAVRVQAVADAEEIVLRLTWHDRTGSRGEHPDAVAIALRPETETGPLPSASWYNAPPQARDLIYWSADREQAQEAVSDDVAGMATGRESGVTLTGAASYADGRWTLLIRRPLRQRGLPGAVAMTGQPVPCSVAVWDGGHDERGRKGGFSTWIPLATAAGAASPGTQH